MNTGFFFNRRVRQATTIVLLLLAVSTMLPARYPRLHWWAAQAHWVALAYLLAAMGLLVFNRTRLMFVCLGCSAAICLFFNETGAKKSLPAPPGAAVPTRPDTTPVYEPAPTPQ